MSTDEKTKQLLEIGLDQLDWTTFQASTRGRGADKPGGLFMRLRKSGGGRHALAFTIGKELVAMIGWDPGFTKLVFDSAKWGELRYGRLRPGKEHENGFAVQYSSKNKGGNCNCVMSMRQGLPFPSERTELPGVEKEKGEQALFFKIPSDILVHPG